MRHNTNSRAAPFRFVKPPTMVAVFLAIGLLLGACGESAGSSEEKLTVTLAWLPNYEYAGNYIADSKGFYQDAGITVELVGGGPNAPAPEQLLESGEADIAYEANITRLVDAMIERQDLVILAAQLQESPVGLLSLADHPVREVEDLKGTRICAATRAKETVTATMKMLGVSDYTFVAAGSGVGPLLADECDALWSFATNQPVTLATEFNMERGKDFFFVSLGKLGRPSYSDVIIAERSFVKQNPDKVVAFLKGTIRGWKRAMEEPRLGARLTVEEYGASLGLDFDTALRKIKLLTPYLTSEDTQKHGLLWVDTEKFAGPIYEFARTTGRTGLPDPAKVINTSYLKQAYAELSSAKNG